MTELFKGSNSSSSDPGGGGGVNTRPSLLSKMWMSGSGVKYGAAIKETLFDELYQEVRNTAPCAQLSCILRRRLERVGDKSIRSVIVSQIRDGCSPLFLACKKGNVEIVDYLITVCGADFEQKGKLVPTAPLIYDFCLKVSFVL